MVHRTHWYLLLLVGTVMGIVSCSSQPPSTQDVAATPKGTMAVAESRPDVTISLAAHQGDDSMTDVVVRDNVTQAEHRYDNLVDVFRDHYRAAQMAGNGIFVVHRTGGSQGYASNPSWTDSLWLHQNAGSGIKLLEGRGLDARVSYDGRFVTAVTEKDVSVLRDRQVLLTKPLSALMPENKELLMIAPAAVSSGVSWFESSRAATLAELVRLDNATGAIEHFDLAKEAVGGSHIRDIEPLSGKIAFWDRPMAFDVETAAAYDAKESHLQVFDPQTRKTQTLLTLAPGKRIEEMHWKSGTTISYREQFSAQPQTLTLP